jgi:hypothetical protein
MNVDLARRQLTISSSTTSSKRTVPFAGDVLRILEARRQRQPESEYVLCASLSALLHHVARKLAAISNDMGIGQVSMRSLSLPSCKPFFDTGTSVSTMKAILGLK